MATTSPAKRPLLIHVGYHKTATTWLQNIVLTPRNHFHTVMTQDEVFDHVIAPHGLTFDTAPVVDRMSKAAAAAPEAAACDVISLEALTGLPYTGGRESEDYARRLHAIAPDARILITIREQLAILGSVYMQYLFRGGTEAPARFFDETAPRGFFRFTADNFRYDRLVEFYQNLFGKDRVLVLTQELIATDQADAITRLARFCGNQPLTETQWEPRQARGVSYPQYSVPALRRANHFRSGPMNPHPMIDLGSVGQMMYRGVGWIARRLPGSEGLKKRRPVTDLIRKRYEGYFVESNRRLAGLLPADTPGLSRYQGLENEAP